MPLCVWIQNDAGVCPIHGAAASGKLDVIIELIEKYAVNPRCKTMKVCTYAKCMLHVCMHLESVCMFAW